MRYFLKPLVLVIWSGQGIRKHVKTKTCRVDDGWMTCNFTSFSTVFQSYQDNRQTIMKDSVQWNPVYG